MADTAQATVTIPGATPDAGALTEFDDLAPLDDTADHGLGEAPFRAPLRRVLVGRGRRGGGGGGPRPTRRQDGSGRIDLRNTWQILAGSILVPLGVVFILMSWYGAAHTAYVQQQIPYLVSGSFAGVGCLVLGGLLYWAHWLYRIYDQADMHHEEQLRVLERTLRALSDRIGGTEPATSAASGPVAGAAACETPTGGIGSSPPPSYVVTPSGTVYHLPTCPVVAHHPEGLRTIAPDAVSSLEPCRICLSGAG